MFGYVIANYRKLTDEEKKRYRSYYCGLCRALGKRHGQISRVTLTYDMTFLVLLLSSLYEPDTTAGRERCAIHPLAPHDFRQNEITDYAADMNVALAYYNFLDDWTDDRNVISLGEAKLFEKENERIASQYPRQCSVIRESLAELSAIEKSGEMNPDIPANCFGRLMGEIFAWREDGNSDNLRAFGAALGKFIYIMDACLDLKSDIRKERYNPMTASSSRDFGSILNILMAECADRYRRLPVGNGRSLIENILYSGVWTKFETVSMKKRSDRKNDIRSI